MAIKKFINGFSIVCLLLIITPLSGQTQNLKEFSTVDSLQVGDTFDFSITLDKNQEYDNIAFPDSSHFGGTFEIRSQKQFKVSEYKDSVYYKLQFFGTVDTLIPKLPVQLVEEQDTTTIYTKPIPVGFNSILAGNEDSLRPLKPIFEFARAWWPYLLGFLILAIVAYYAYQYYLQWQEQQQQEKERPTFTPTPFQNPLKEYRKSIQQLENAELSTQEDYKDFYSDLGDAIRQYYESLYNLPALESTSGELLNMLQNGSIDQDLINDTRAVLQEADMVKFAKFNPTPKQAERALQKAYNFLDRAQQIDGPRIDHLRRKHQAKMETRREKFYEEHENSEKVNA
ncbi:hypothetical protein [Fodinibius sp. AD559]|uniref:hypothetical protein n=1 Tax=Fodinibius sp. AD559 TaxID=3424179 RepID=UPI0040468C1B